MSREPAPYVVIAHPLVELVSPVFCAIMTPGLAAEESAGPYGLIAHPREALVSPVFCAIMTPRPALGGAVPLTSGNARDDVCPLQWEDQRELSHQRSR